MFEKLETAKEMNPFTQQGKLKSAAKLSSLPLKLMKGLNYTDYILLGISTFGTARKLFSLFRKKKR